MKASEKPVRFMMSRGFAEHYNYPEPLAYIGLAQQLWKKEPIDMLIFEDAPEPGFMVISANGYNVDTDKYVDTKKVLKLESLPIRKFWLKYDDYGDHWIATFLFPEEY